MLTEPVVKVTNPAMLIPKTYDDAASPMKKELPFELIKLSDLLTEPIQTNNYSWVEGSRWGRSFILVLLSKLLKRKSQLRSMVPLNLPYPFVEHNKAKI
jgi:hypothetical protein